MHARGGREGQNETTDASGVSEARGSRPSMSGTGGESSAHLSRWLSRW